MNHESRDLAAGLSALALEQRAGSSPRLVGYAAVYFDEDDPDTQFELWSGAVERIAPGAFDRAIKTNQDIVALYNHDANMLLGRRSAGTLDVESDDVGLRYSIDLGKSATADNVRESVIRGDLVGSSFSFYIADGGETWGTDGDTKVRTITDVDVLDVGPVVFPAYKASTVEAASRRSLARWMARQRQASIGKRIVVAKSLGIEV